MEGINEIKSHRELYLLLLKEFRLIHLVWHRNKNQHRVSTWWKRLAMMKRNCGQVIEILQHPTVDKNRDLVRLYKLINDFKRRQLPRTYYDFNGVIGLGQFVTLGVVLVGLLSRVFVVYKRLMELFEDRFKDAGCVDDHVLPAPADLDLPLEKIQTYNEVEEIGEEIHEQSVGKISNFQEVVTPTVKKPLAGKKSSKKKKKKTKSVIDSIFG